jgi:hypothetical protein
MALRFLLFLIAGIWLFSCKSWGRFWALQLVSADPGNGAIAVAADKTISLTFNADIDGATANSNSIQIKCPNPQPGIYMASGKIVSFTHSIPLGVASTCTVTIGTELKSTGGSTLNEPTTVSFSTAGVISFYTMLGGSGADGAEGVSQTSDGGYVLIGSAGANIATLGGQMPLNGYVASNDFLVVKLNSAGSVTFYTFLGSSGNDLGKGIKQTSDGGYIVTGSAGADIPTLGGQTPLNAYAGSNDFLVVKLNAAGGISWYTFLGGTGSEAAQWIQQTTDGGYILAGFASATIATLGGVSPVNAYAAANDALIVKLAANGGVSWYTFLGDAGADNAQAIQQTADGGYILAGTAGADIPMINGQSPLNAYAAGNDMLIAKLSSTGAVSFYTMLGGAGNELAETIIQTSDGGYLLAGSPSANIGTLGGQSPLNPYTASNDQMVVKLTASGTVSWYSFFGGTGVDTALSVQQTIDGYVVAGSASANISTLGGQTPLNAYSSLSDLLIVKLSLTGAVQWYTFLGAGGSDVANAIEPTSEGGFIIAGNAGADIPTLAGQSPLNAYVAGTDILVVKLRASGGF